MEPSLTAVVSALEEALGEIVAGVDHLLLEVVVLGQVLEQLLGVARVLDLLGHFRVSEDLQDGVGGSLEGLELFHDLQSLFRQLLRNLLIGIEGLVHLHGVVHHVGVGQKIQLAPEQVGVIVDAFHRQKFHQRDDQVSVQVGPELGGQLPGGHFGPEGGLKTLG